MDNYVYLKEQTLKRIADAIRAKTKSSSKITPVNMPVEIAKISGGSPSFKVIIKQTPNQTIMAKVDRIEFANDNIYNIKGFYVAGLEPVILATIRAKKGYKAGTIQKTQNGNVWTITATEATKWTPEFVEGWAVYTFNGNGDPIRLVNGIEEPWNSERGIYDDKSIIDIGDDSPSAFYQFPISATIIRVGKVNIPFQLQLNNDFNGKIIDLGENDVTEVNANNKEVIIDTRGLSAGSLTKALNSVANSSNNANVTLIVDPAKLDVTSVKPGYHLKIVFGDTNVNTWGPQTDLMLKGWNVLTLSDWKKQTPDLADYIE